MPTAQECLSDSAALVRPCKRASPESKNWNAHSCPVGFRGLGTAQIYTNTEQGWRLEIEGRVQGVGFRPWVYRCASELELAGQVCNTRDGVSIDILGDQLAVDAFVTRLRTNPPPLVMIDRIDRLPLQHLACTRFSMAATSALSPLGGGAAGTMRDQATSAIDARPEVRAHILPDVAPCDACVEELFDPGNRRFRYPFISCADCGPRFSILEALPYDRANTSMDRFPFCDACRHEYESIEDRRCHAQSYACSNCGPVLSLVDTEGESHGLGESALLGAVAAIGAGKIVAVKAVGGYQLLVDASNEAAVRTLRERKARPDKPFALMASAVAVVERHCQVSRLEREALLSRQAPIVLLERCMNHEAALASSVAPRNPMLGFMLPSSPLHHLLMHELDGVVVATSGNPSGDPIAFEDNAVDALSDIADMFLLHDRPIVNPQDDSVVRVVADRLLPLRLARGYTPLSIPLVQPDAQELPDILALGAQIKTAPGIVTGNRLVLAAPVGDLDSAAARRAYQRSLQHLQDLHALRPVAVACDTHPGYHTTSLAKTTRLPTVQVQHHLAHVMACQVDNQLSGPVLGVAWDGTGQGEDGGVWGGEFLLVNGCDVRRVGHLLPFRLPGGEAAVREPRRSAIGLLDQLLEGSIVVNSAKEELRGFTLTETQILRRMLAGGINSPFTTSMGRFFDGIASLIGLQQQSSFEGQAAMALEFAALDAARSAEVTLADLSFHIDIVAPELTGSDELTPCVLDWRPLLTSVLIEYANGRPAAVIAWAVHRALVDSVVSIAKRVGEKNVVLAGGCFQNRLLSEGVIDQLRQAGFSPWWHRQLPPNDGSLAVGQAAWAVQEFNGRTR